MGNHKVAMFVLASLMCSAPLARGQNTWSDDFEDGAIDSDLWVWGGDFTGAAGGSWQFSHEEIIDADGYLKMRVWGPTSGITHGAEAWVRTQYDYNDGSSYIINFTWETAVNASHVDMYAIQITDGTAPPGDGNVFWFGSGSGPIDGPTWANVYFEHERPDMSPPEDWSICINAANDTAMVFDGPNCTGDLKGENTLPSEQAWYVRLILADATSSGFPAGDNLLNVYDLCSHPTTWLCGDGVVDPGEECDDGNDVDIDMCTNTCEINPNAIPTVSEWGLAVMALLMLTAGTLVYARRRPVRA